MLIISKKALFLMFFAVPALIFAATTPRSSALKILKKYNASAAVQIKTTRAETKKTLGTTTTSEGDLTYANKKIYFVTEKPNKTEIIYNKSVWVIEYPDLELDDKAGRKVTVFDAQKISFLKAMADVFSAPEKFLTKDASISQVGDDLIWEINKLKSEHMKEVIMILDKKQSLIKSISLIDDLETQTVLTFEKTDFLKSAPKNKFTYKKLKTDEILKP